MRRLCTRVLPSGALCITEHLGTFNDARRQAHAFTSPAPAPAAPEPPKAAPAAPEPAKAAPAAPAKPQAAPAAPAKPQAAPAAPAKPQAAPAAPAKPQAAPAAPAKPQAAPAAPAKPQAAPAKPQAAPAAPAKPQAAPAAPEPPKAAPAAPAKPQAAPAAPEPAKAAPAAPEPPKAAPAAPEPPKAAPAAPAKPQAAPAAPEPPKAAPAAPAKPQAAPAAPAKPQAAPAAPEPPKAAPAAPEPPKAAPAAPAKPQAAPAAPEPAKAAPAAPEPAKAAPAAPEPPKAAPAAPAKPQAAPAAPAKPQAAPAAPAKPQAAPAAPAKPQAAPAAPAKPQAAPAAPAKPQAAPAAPAKPQAAPAAPAKPQAAPAAPAKPQAAPAAPEPPKAAPDRPPMVGGNRKGNGSGNTTSPGRRVDPRRGNQKDSRRNSPDGRAPVADGRRSRMPPRTDVVSDVGELKVVFSQRSAPRQPPPPPKVPTAPRAPRSPVALKGSETLSSAPKDVKTDDIPAVPISKVGLTAGVDDDLFFTIAPPTGMDDSDRSVPASMSLAMDEEIAKARASRPLKGSPLAAHEPSVRLNLDLTRPTDSVVFGEKEEESVVSVDVEPVDKESLRPLSEKDAAAIDRHEVPEAISEQAASPADLPKNSSECSAEASAAKEAETILAVEHSPKLMLDDISPILKSGDSVDASKTPCVKVRYDSTDSRRIAIIELQNSPSTPSCAVRELHEAITTLESDPNVTHVVLTTLPSLDFFEPLQGLAEMPAAARLEAHRSKAHLFRRIRAAAPRLDMVAIAHGRGVRDFGAELFLACHRRVLLEPSAATFGFPSIARGDYPSAETTQRLSEWIGASRTVEIAPRLHEFSAESLVTMGLTGTANNAHEVFARLTAEPSGGDTNVSLGTKGDGAHAPMTPTRWALRVVDVCMTRGPPRVRLLRWLLFRRGFDFTPANPNPLLQEWTRYAVTALTADGNGCDDVLSEALYSAAAANVSRVCATEAEMMRRSLLPLPGGECIAFRGSEMQIWPEKAKSLAATRENSNTHREDEKNQSHEGEVASCPTVFLDASPRFIDATRTFLADHRAGSFNDLRDVNIVLLGSAGDALAASMPCAAVVANVSPLRDCALQEVRLFARDDCPAARRRETLSAAFALLHRERRPAVLCRGKCGERLLAALVAESFRAAWGSGDAAGVERAATDLLGLTVAPLRLVDHIGAKAVLQMIERDEGDDYVPPVARHALRDMCADGLLGCGAPRGGFYAYDSSGRAKELRMDVQRQYIRRRGTDADVADRLLAVVVNACCELLLANRLHSAADANALTVAVLGFRETTGGALALADAYGIAALTRRMDEMAEWHGQQLRPSPLLRCMAHAKVSFASLSDAVVQSARS